MSESPLGPRDYNLASLQDEHFEEMCGLLVLIEFPEAQPTANPDGGADTLLPRPGHEAGWLRAWQAKRFGGTMYWAQCKKSLDDAVANYGVEHYTFLFPRDLTHGQIKKFATDLSSRHKGVRVDHWGRTRLLALLNGSDQGQRIGKRYFGPGPPDTNDVLRTMRAGGDLTGVDQALERGVATGAIVNASDPHFSYTGIQFESATQPPLTPGAVMSMGLTRDGITSRYDAIPRQEALGVIPPITVNLSFDDTEAGRRSAAVFDGALRYRQPAEITEGFTLSTAGAPSEFQPFADSIAPQVVKIVPDPPPPWEAILEADTAPGRRRLELTMEPMLPDDGYQAAFMGTHLGLAATINIRASADSRGSFNFSWRHSVTDAPARAHLSTLRFLEALHGEGRLWLTHKPTGTKAEIGLHTTDFPLAPVLALMEAVVRIEEWISEDIVLPRDTPSDSDLQTVALASQAIQAQAISLAWPEPEAFAPPEQIPGEPVALHLESALTMNLFGRTYPLGHAVLNLPAVDVVDLGPTESDPNVHKITLRPINDASFDTEWALAKPRRG